MCTWFVGLEEHIMRLYEKKKKKKSQTRKRIRYNDLNVKHVAIHEIVSTQWMSYVRWECLSHWNEPLLEWTARMDSNQKLKKKQSFFKSSSSKWNEITSQRQQLIKYFRHFDYIKTGKSFLRKSINWKKN